MTYEDAIKRMAVEYVRDREGSVDLLGKMCGKFHFPLLPTDTCLGTLKTTNTFGYLRCEKCGSKVERYR